MPRDHICVGRVMTLVGPSRRWRSPELAAGCWGSSAALGPQGATYAAGRRGAITPGARKGPQVPVAAPRSHEPRREGRVVGCQRMATGVGVGRKEAAGTTPGSSV
jgi:hypothetical protein